MKSSTLIGLGSNNVPVIEIKGIKSNDVRDKLTRQFIDQVMETRLAYVHVSSSDESDPFGVLDMAMVTLYPLTKEDNDKNYPSGFPLDNITLNTSIRRLISGDHNVAGDQHLIEEAISCVVSVHTAMCTIYDKNLMMISYGQEAVTISLVEVKDVRWMLDRIVYEIPTLVELLEDNPDAHELAKKISLDIHNLMFINNIPPKIVSATGDHELPKQLITEEDYRKKFDS